MPAQAGKSLSGLPVNGERTQSLVDILVARGKLDDKAAKSIKLTEVQSGKTQEDIIKSENLVDEDALTNAKAALYKIPFIDLNSTPISPEALALLPQQVAARFKVVPVSVNTLSKEMILAMSDPLDFTAIEFVEQRTGYIVKPHAAAPSRIDLVLSTTYATSLAKEVTDALKEVNPEEGRIRTLDIQKTGVIREEKVAEIVSHILSFAVKARASDVHIEPQDRATRVRYRIDGILQENLTTPKELHEALISRIKILSGMKIDEKRVPQDRKFNFKTENKEVDLRVSSLPTSWGEKIVMRILEKSGGIPTINELGLRGKALKNLQDAILTPHGIILLCGPTGSGKTTSLYSIIQRLNSQQVNIVTLEDPIEYKISGVNQVQINPTADLTLQASLTGHLVFATLHTNNASDALPRLHDMGAEPYLLAASMTAIIAQRVVRKIHEGCKTSYTGEAKIISDMHSVLGTLWTGGDTVPKVYKGSGDDECGNTGYYGRIGIFEVLPVTEKVSRLILERSPSSAIER